MSPSSLALLPSTRPYIIRALHDWCSDHGFTPYLEVKVDESVQVPREHVVDGGIVLNISNDATGELVLGNEFITFKARFGGIAQQVHVPVHRVSAIFARENGQGMSFAVVQSDGGVGASAAATENPPSALVLVSAPGPLESPLPEEPDDPGPGDKPPSGTRPSLVRIK